MGYTHYYDIPASIPKEAIQSAIFEIEDIVKRHSKVLAYECNQPSREPLVSPEKGIHFNGIDEDGHETFVVPWEGGRQFCKTARKPYDQAVCECLLVLRARIPGFRLSSDGFSSSLQKAQLDGTWPQAMEAVKKYGLFYRSFISCHRAPYCDLGMILTETGVDGERVFDHDGLEQLQGILE